jgi:hypothetical protein
MYIDGDDHDASVQQMLGWKVLVAFVFLVYDRERERERARIGIRENGEGGWLPDPCCWFFVTSDVVA